jgi:hypothetical protein
MWRHLGEVTMNDSDIWTIGGSTALDMEAPAAAAALRALVAAQPASLDPASVATLRATSAGVTGLPPLGGAAAAPNTVDPAVIAFTEQFGIDVSSMNDAQRAAAGAVLGDATFDAVQAIYVGDFVPRLYAALDAVFGPSDWPSPDPAPTADTWSVVETFIQDVARVQVLDPVATELVRLRGARQHECRLCKSRRNATAIREGADEATFEAVDHYADSDLPERIKAALALTDAMIWQPAHIAPDVVAGVRAHLTPAEAVEVALDVTRNAANKIPVALASDAPEVTEGVELFDMDTDGNLTYGMTV